MVVRSTEEVVESLREALVGAGVVLPSLRGRSGDRCQ
jgi:hypothetical protein